MPRCFPRIRSFLTAAALVLGAWPLGAQPFVELGGDWKFALDKEAAGEALEWAAPNFDDSAWETHRLPGKWEYQGYPDYNGAAWYRREVTLPEAWRSRPLTFQMPPADESDRVYWNGVEIGRKNNDFQKQRLYAIPPEAVKWGGPNIVAIQVIDKFGNGGLNDGAFRVLTPGEFAPAAVHAAGAETVPPLDLRATDDLEEVLKQSANWKYGWFDPGTTDTRPALAARPGPREGTRSLGFNVRFPNASGEFINYMLPEDVTGATWAARGYNYLKFSYQTEDLEGEFKLHLNAGNYRFGTGGAGWSTSFPVRPGREWKTVILPVAEFAKRTHKSLEVMPDTRGVKALSLGYGNHELRGPGEIRFADFQLGRLTGGNREVVDLGGLWHLQTDPNDEGLANGWAAPEFADAGWSTLVPGTHWEAQGLKGYNGVGWLRQQARVPDRWRGLPLRLRLGKAMDDAEVYWNGAQVHQTTKWDKGIDTILTPEQVRAGALNQLAVRVTDRGNMGGLAGGPYELAPESAWLMLGRAGEALAYPESFDPGALAEGQFEVAIRVPREQLPPGELTAAYTLTDCFFREIATGTAKLEPVADQPFREARLRLDATQSRRLFYSEMFDFQVLVSQGDEPVLAAGRRNIQLPYARRDALALPELPETREETPYGRLPLVDVVEAAKAPEQGPHPYKEGGIRGSWVGRKAYATWETGIGTREYQGRQYREAGNNEWFGYRVGRGKMKAGAAYLVRIEYPEDKSRYVPVNIDAGTNYQGLGFKTGAGEDDPFDNYPLRGGYQFYDVLVIPGDRTYGAAGSRSVPVDHGFWIFFHDNGRAFTPQYQGGPAVSQIRVYKVEDLATASPLPRYPGGQPRRYFIADWEREPEFVPADLVRHARFSGYNAISPSLLTWGSLAFWQVEGLPLKPTKPIREPLAPGEPSVLQGFLEATRDSGLTLFPRLEFAGSEALPKEARALGPDGKLAKPNRFHTWGGDLLQPALTEEFGALFQEVIGKNIAANPQLGGVLFRMRSDRLPISYSRFDVELFARETGTALPAGDDVALAKWAAKDVKDAYETWWHGKRRDFHAALAEMLRRQRPDLKLLYYNWDSDNWNLGVYPKKAQDYTDYYDVSRSPQYYQRAAAYQRGITPETYVEYITGMGQAHHQVRAPLYAGLENFVLLGPVNWRYLADNPAYLEHFRAGPQLGLSKIFNYEEKGRWNVQGDNYESSEMSTGGPDFAMAEQVLAVFHADPWTLTETTYTYGQGFLETHRRFAQAYLALPALPAADIPSAPDLRVRRYPADDAGRTTLGLAHRGTESREFRVALPGSWTGRERVTDAVTGESLPARLEGRELHLTLTMPPMSLRTLRLE
jgi:hypothetical protein